MSGKCTSCGGELKIRGKQGSVYFLVCASCGKGYVGTKKITKKGSK